MKNIIYIIFFFPLLTFGQIDPNSDKPHIRISSARVATSDESDLDDHTKAVTEIKYMDGLGRQMQMVMYKASPTEKDLLIGTNTLDNVGRIKLNYLPVSTTATNGKFQSNVSTLAQSFYSDTAPYIEVETYEQSLMSRPFKIIGAGQAFRPTPSTTKGVNQSYYIAGADVRKYIITEDVNGNVTLVNGSQNFVNGNLLKTTTTDEEGNTVSEFTDKEGRIIEKRVVSATNNSDILTTAYVYDDLGRLRYIIPPKAYLSTNQFNEVDTPNTDYFKDGIFAFRYDIRGRTAETHTPNGGWTYTIYNELDQAVMTQNPFQRESNLWEWIRYDGHGRIIMAGTWTSASSISRTTMQSYFLNFLVDNQFEERSTAEGNLYNYTNRSFPSDITIQTSDVRQIYYFDDYTWVNDNNLEFQLYQIPQYTNVKGLSTGSIIKLLDNVGTALKSVIYYDDKNRVIQSQAQNRFGAINQMDKVYTFSGECLEEKMIYRKPSQPDRTIKTKYTLDHTGRVKNAIIQYNNDTPVPLANYKYDAIGRLIQKRLQEVENDSIVRQNEVLSNGQLDMAKKYILLKQGTYNATNGTYCAVVNAGVLQIIDYAYNIRGQLKSINGGALNTTEGDIFAMNLDYHEDNRYFNGLISKQSWQSSTQPDNRTFTYTYDGFTRVKSASYSGVNSENYSLGDVVYDANGNITNLLRNGLSGSNSYAQIDNLTYLYPINSNRLEGIRDDANKTKGFVDNNNDSDFTYYSDGKLKTDANKGITNITYNYMGMPKQIDFGTTKRIENLYNAGGQKLSETFINGSQTIIIDYMGSLIYRNDSLKTILHDEGRIAFKNDTSYTYQFFLKDHLGNTRVVIERLNANTALAQETHYGAWGEVLEGIGQTGDWNFLFQGKQLIDGLGYDFHTRLYDEWSGRMMQIDGANQYASGYTGMGNNPVSMIDPDGQVAIAGITGFFKGLFTKRDNFEAGANTRFGNALMSAGRHINNSAKIWGGLFASDRNKSFGGRVWETFSRFTWQAPQTIIGFGYSQSVNLVKRVDGVEYYGGATFVQGGGSGRGSVTLGSYINLARYDIDGIQGDDEVQVGVFGEGGYTFMHEYGHYIQSQEMGFLYLFKVGIQSINGADWTEHDANLRASQYFFQNEGFRWNENYFRAGSGEEQYSQFPASRTTTKAKWWEYALLMYNPILSGLYYYKTVR